MAEPFVVILTHTIKEGRTEDFEEFLHKLCSFVEANEPRLIHFGVHISPDGREATGVQIHPDPDSMEFHMQVAGEKMMEAYEYLDGTTSIQVYGSPSEALLGRMRQMAGSGVPVTVASRQAGFSRIPAS